MSAIVAFGRFLPEQVLDNQTLARSLGCDSEWILQSSGIEERRIAAPGESVADLGVKAAQDCLAHAFAASSPCLIIAASGSAERRFPGPAAQIAQRLGFAGIPAIDLPIASAGSLFGIALAAHLAPVYGPVLVVAAGQHPGGHPRPAERPVRRQHAHVQQPIVQPGVGQQAEPAGQQAGVADHHLPGPQRQAQEGPVLGHDGRIR